MGKRGPKPKQYTVKNQRVGTYFMPNTRNRINWLKNKTGAPNQDAAIAAALDIAGVPPVVSDDLQVVPA
jgi:hypothetical protein